MEGSIGQLRRILRRALHKRCWNVTAGGCTLPEFTLAMGRKVRRRKALRNPALSTEFRHFEGEVSFFIRCAWRVDRCGSIVASNIDSEEHIASGLNNLLGRTLLAITVVEPGWDLVLRFTSGWRLTTFSTYTENFDDIMKNWHARIAATKVYAGPGVKIEIKDLSCNYTF